jgi:SAM-dependent methyltransferase
VTAMDQSPVALARGRALAVERGVSVTFVEDDLARFDLGEGRWQGIVSTFAHVPPALRRDVHARAVRALAPGGVLILEAYAPAQLARTTGGPRDVELLMRAEVLREELAGLDVLIAHEVERAVREGPQHTGIAAVVQVVARKG